MSRESISVDNFDEVRLGMRKEMDRLSKKMASNHKPNTGINLAMNINGMNDLMEMLLKLMEILSSIDYKPNINIHSPEFELPVFNIPEIKIPEIKAPSVHVPTPQVTVNPSIDIDLNPIIKALENLKYLSDRANKPLSVRMSDGNKFIKAIQQLEKATENLGVVYSGSSGVSSDELRAIGLAVPSTLGDGSKVVTTAGTRVQLSTSSIACNWVNIIGKESNTDTIWVGGSTVASGSGQPIVALQSTDIIKVNNLSNIWIDSEVSGEGVTYIYGS